MGEAERAIPLRTSNEFPCQQSGWSRLLTLGTKPVLYKPKPSLVKHPVQSTHQDVYSACRLSPIQFNPVASPNGLWYDVGSVKTMTE
jgi:hypothetical protein